MQTKPNHPSEAGALRRRAEDRLREQHPETGRARTEADIQRLFHELQVHQIELEMQNEELQHARDEMEAAMERYSDLFEFAPAGYLTLDREGTILEANLSAAGLLGIERSRLVKRRMGSWVAMTDRAAFAAFLTKVFGSKVREFCEVRLLREGRAPVEIRIEAAMAASGRECRAVLADITERKQAAEHLRESNTELTSRSGQLLASNGELTRFNSAMVGRELRMSELKEEINELCWQTGLPLRYPVREDHSA